MEGVNVVVHQWDSLSTHNMFGENKIIGFNVPSLNGVQTEPCKKKKKKAARSRGTAVKKLLHVGTCFGTPPPPPHTPTNRSTFVGCLQVLFLKHQVVALHCSRVELQPENNFTFRRCITFVIAFNLQKTQKQEILLLLQYDK